MHAHIALAQFRPSKGDIESSFARLSDWFGRLRTAEDGPGLVVFPETATTGYFLEGGIRDHALTVEDMLSRVGAAWEAAAGEPRPLDVVIGFFEKDGRHFYNSALYAELGETPPRLRHLHRKVFLPTYGVFQEERFVEAGDRIDGFDTRLGRAAILICEDFWHPAAVRAALDSGAGLLIVPSASPARGAEPGPGMPGNVARWKRLAGSIAGKHGVAVVVSQLVGFEGGKGFAGGSLACAADGEVLHRSTLWDEALDDVTLEIPDRTGARRSSRGSTGATSPALDAPSLVEADAEEAVERGYAEPRPDEDPRDLSRLEIDAALVEEWLVRFLRDEMARGRGFEQAVVGMSGGVDSSLTAALCVRAFGPGNVHGFLLPHATSSPESAEHAELVADRLGIDTRTIDITRAVDGYVDEFEPDAGPTRRGNVMARMRMIVLFDQAAKLGALPVGTGNKSERLLGYFTWHADDSPPINPLGDLFKTQVWALARHMGLPEIVIAKPATADLVRGQTDEADLGVSYPEADRILLHLVEGRSAAWLETAGFDPENIRTVRRRLESTHWKRNLPTVAMLSSTTIGEWYLRPVDY